MKNIDDIPTKNGDKKETTQKQTEIRSKKNG